MKESDIGLLPYRYRAVVRASELLRRTSELVKPLRKLAGSVYLESTKRAPTGSP